MLKRIVRNALPDRLIDSYWQWQFDRDLPPRARDCKNADARGLPGSDPGAEAAISASIGWLCRAQDQSLSADGGVARHYSLISGWSDSYPETTGYIIPTFIQAATARGPADLGSRTRRMLDWCVEIQDRDGAFQGGTIWASPKVPSTFNTGQILIGLAAGTGAFGDAAYAEAMHKAASWLRDSQDPDGCWRRFPSLFAKPGDKVYETHVAWGLFEADRISPDSGYGEAGLRQVRWALTRQKENGWFADCCLTDPGRPLTHTIGYALRGVLEAHRFSGDESFLNAALRPGRALVSCLKPDGWLAGRLGPDWRPAVSWSCLTGTVQIAWCWLRLHALTGERAFRDAACRANAFARRTIAISGDPDIIGGVKGSFPVNGHYGRYEFLNWAAKFSIDANRAEIGEV